MEAIRFNGRNLVAVCCWANQGGINVLRDGTECTRLEVLTREGSKKAEIGDWIVRGVTGSFYPCKDVEFRETHEVMK